MRSLRRAPYIANEVRLKRTQHLGSFLLLEGPDDSRFYRRFIDNEQCQIVVGWSKENVISAVGLLEGTNHTGVVGVVDYDFDHLNGNALPSPNLVYGDCHDLEAMLIRSPALEAVLNEIASPKKLILFEEQFGISVRMWLLDAAQSLGYLRWHSLSLGLNLRFEGLRFSRFINRKTSMCEPDALVTELRNHSQIWSVSEDQLREAGWPANRNDDPWHVCCGQDMAELLTLALRGIIGSQQNLSVEDVRRSLRLAYSDLDFAGSEVCTAIKRWEENAGFRVLRTIVPRNP